MSATFTGTPRKADQLAKHSEDTQEGSDAQEARSLGVDVAAGARPRKRIRPLRVVATVIAGDAVPGLLAFGVLAQSPNTSIDDSLAQGHPARAPAFALPILQRGALGDRLEQRLASALSGQRLSIGALRGVSVVLNVWASWRPMQAGGAAPRARVANARAKGRNRLLRP